MDTLPTQLSAVAAVARHALIVGDGDVPARTELDAAWPGWDAGVVDVVAADGGLARAWALGLRPDVLVGDLDSLEPALLGVVEAEGILVRRFPTDKDESDTELALLEAIARGATRVTVLGAFGGPRLDHALANLWLLAHPVLVRTEITLLDASSRAFLVQAPGKDGGPVTVPLPGPDGALVTLLPFGGNVVGITTVGLAYPLRDEPLVVGPARGLSNIRMGADAAVTVRDGRLLVVETALPPGRLSSGS